MQRIFLINLLWQKALSCQAFPAKKKISDKKCNIFSIIFWLSQPTSGIASGILKTKHRTNTERSPPRNALFFRSTAPLPAKCSAAPEAAANTKTACRTFPSADGLQLRQQESNLRWGSQSPLPYRLAMAHCREYKYSRMFPICQAKTSLTKPARSLMIKEKRKGDGLWEFPIVKDTTPNMMNPRLYTTSYNKPQGQQFDDTAVLSFIKLQYT